MCHFLVLFYFIKTVSVVDVPTILRMGGWGRLGDVKVLQATEQDPFSESKKMKVTFINEQH